MKISWFKFPNKSWTFVFWFYFAILMTISISAYLKMIPVKLSMIPFSDTIGHFILIGLATFFAHLALKKRKINILTATIALAPLLVGFFTLTDEILQRFSPYRTFSISDLAADLVGIIFFYWLAEQVKLKKLSEE